MKKIQRQRLEGSIAAMTAQSGAALKKHKIPFLKCKGFFLFNLYHGTKAKGAEVKER